MFAVVNYFPWRAIDKYTIFWGMRPDIRELARNACSGPSLVLVRGQSHPDYTSAQSTNPPDFRSAQPLYAWGQVAQVREQLIEAYPNRAHFGWSTALRFRDRVQGRGRPRVRSDLETNVQAEEPGRDCSLDVFTLRRDAAACIGSLAKTVITPAAGMLATNALAPS